MDKSKYAKDLESHVFDSVLDEAYDSITLKLSLHKSTSNKILVNVFDDHLDSLFISYALNDLDPREDSSMYMLMENLRSMIGMNPVFDFDNYNSTNFDFTTNDSDQGYGLSTITRISFNAQNSVGLFYCDFQGESEKSGGYFVVVKKDKNNDWGILALLDSWTTQ